MWRYHPNTTPAGIEPVRTYREVGEIVGLSTGGVKQVESRAFMKMRRYLDENPDLKESLEEELDFLTAL